MWPVVIGNMMSLKANVIIGVATSTIGRRKMLWARLELQDAVGRV